ncbi:MAG: hypothetical protein HOJ35_02335 [Bdellovibrionales bacterium]|jgi:hypothetical protein|nr:hypothetical protein [Bdellovibrionales bacterium]
MKSKIYISVILIALLSIGVIYGILNYNYSKGVRSGHLVKISKKGMLLKTYEGTLDLGSGDNLTWNFSVHNPKIGEELVKASGKKIKLEYRELLFRIFYTTKYDILGFTVESDSKNNFCRLINLLRTDHKIVNLIRSLLEQKDPNLLSAIRECQI